MQLNVIKKFFVELQDYVKYHFISLFFILSTFFFSELRLNFQLNLKICFLPLMLSGKMVFDGNFNQIGDTINRNTTLEIQFGLWFFNYFIKNLQADVINLFCCKNSFYNLDNFSKYYYVNIGLNFYYLNILITKCTLRKTCPNTEFFLVRIFLHSD